MATGSAAPGFGAFYKSGLLYPGTSNINFAAGQTIAVTSYTAVDASSRMAIFSNQACDYVIDVLGYYP